jgi:hypothetical protein
MRIKSVVIAVVSNVIKSPQCWCRRLVLNVRGNILGLPRERLGLLPTTGDDMSPLFEPSRANERLLIVKVCFRLMSRQ